jgi:FkbM family methyltransferase
VSNEQADYSDLGRPVVKRFPLLYLLGRSMARRGLPGGFRLIELAGRLGLLDKTVLTRFCGEMDFFYPLFMYPRDYLWIERYEVSLVKFVSAATEGYKNITVIDCGSDIGLMAQKLCSLSQNVSAVVAIEPNSDVHPFLRRNVAAIGLPSKVVEGAASDFSGMGALKSPPGDSSPHARFLVEDDAGTIQVSKIDELVEIDSNKSVLLKIDVEGAELDVLRGAQRTIERARDICIVFEANRRQTQRTGVDPSEIVSQIKQWRDIQLVVAEESDLAFDPSKPFFSQAQQDRDVFNILAYTAQ